MAQEISQGYCRKEVIEFARFMEDVLRDNDHKGGWKDCDKQYLQFRLVEEMGEYFRALNYGGSETLQRKELIDIANFCMMLWDISG